MTRSCSSATKRISRCDRQDSKVVDTVMEFKILKFASLSTRPYTFSPFIQVYSFHTLITLTNKGTQLVMQVVKMITKWQLRGQKQAKAYKVNEVVLYHVITYILGKTSLLHLVSFATTQLVHMKQQACLRLLEILLGQI